MCYRRPARNVAIGLAARIPPVRRALAWRLSGLVWEYGIPPLLPADAAVGTEIVVHDEADPYAN